MPTSVVVQEDGGQNRSGYWTTNGNGQVVGWRSLPRVAAGWVIFDAADIDRERDLAIAEIEQSLTGAEACEEISPGFGHFEVVKPRGIGRAGGERAAAVEVLPLFDAQARSPSMTRSPSLGPWPRFRTRRPYSSETAKRECRR